MIKKVIKKIIPQYFSSLLVYGTAIIFFRTFPYYQKTLTEQTQNLIWYLFLGYLILSPLYYFFFDSANPTNKPLLLIRVIKRVGKYLFQKIFHYSKAHFQWEKEEKVAVLFLLVKFFFLPVMFNFLLNNLANLLTNVRANPTSFPSSLSFPLSSNSWGNIWLDTWSSNWYTLALTIIFTLDTLIFSFGYVFEFQFLNNLVKSVEPTLFGWAVALICYPPFNSLIGDYIPWGANDYVEFNHPFLTLVLRISIISLLTIYVWATFALGPKSSNLTNRGIVTKFPYSLVRHPAYISKNLAWWLTLLPVMSLPFALGMIFWSVIYYFRALTEERHLFQDEEYRKYCLKVRYRFIPGIY